VPIPAVPLPPRRPGAPAALPVDPPPWRSGLREDLVELAADAASPAWEMAVGLSADAGLSLDPDADLARRAARALGTPAFAALAARSGVGPRDLAGHWPGGRAAQPGWNLCTPNGIPLRTIRTPVGCWPRRGPR
jgi:hypothetical protein